MMGLIPLAFISVLIVTAIFCWATGLNVLGHTTAMGVVMLVFLAVACLDDWRRL